MWGFAPPTNEEVRIMAKRRTTEKDIALLGQLRKENQLIMAPEFQRHSVWPRAAKAYLIDTILNDRPIPFLYFRRVVSAQTGRSRYEVIDGQQRLRAIFDFIEGRFTLSETTDERLKGKKYDDLPDKLKRRILGYDLNIEELSDYSDADIRDMFVRMNRFVVKLSRQEIRHAKHSGKFADFVERLGSWSQWKDSKIFTQLQLRRMRSVEFSAELAVLIIEGPQDKKFSIDLYYGTYEKQFPYRKLVESRLRQYLAWATAAFPDFETSRFRKPVHLYSLIGALEEIRSMSPGQILPDEHHSGKALQWFEDKLNSKNPRGKAARYLAASSRQTDNFAPRATRIAILVELIREA
jgi:hypothetical protein